jgi:hypothetical protein
MKAGGDAALAKAREEFRKDAIRLMGLGMAAPGPDFPSLILSSEGANYHRISELLFTKTKEYRRAILSRLRYCHSVSSFPPSATQGDEGEAWEKKKLSIFELITTLLNDATLSPDEREDVKSAAVASLPQLVAVHNDSTASLVLNYFLDDH